MEPTPIYDELRNVHPIPHSSLSTTDLADAQLRGKRMVARSMLRAFIDTAHERSRMQVPDVLPRWAADRVAVKAKRMDVNIKEI